MRKILFIISLFTFTTASAQVAKWVIHPSYEHIRMLGDGYYIVSQGDKYGILDATEKEIVPLQYDSISPFNSHMGLLFNEGKCIGYTSDKGEIHEFTAHQYKLGSMSRFSDGYLAVHNSTGYWYVRAEDGSAIGPYAYASPFCEGYAWVRVPKSLKHVLDGGYTYDVIDAKTGQSAELNLGEEYDKEDIDFISASSNGTCIIVLKKRFFIYDYRKGTLTPMSTDNNPENKKTRVTANERPVKVNTEEKGYSIEPDAAQLLAQSAGTSLRKIVLEIDKLIKGTDGTVIRVKDVEVNIGVSRDYNPFELCKAIGERNILRAFSIAEVFASNSKKYPIQATLGAMFFYFNQLLTVEAELSHGERDFFSACQRAGVFGTQRVREYQTAARNFPLKKTMGVISLIKDTDLKSKSNYGGNSTDGALLNALLTKLFVL